MGPNSAPSGLSARSGQLSSGPSGIGGGADGASPKARPDLLGSIDEDSQLTLRYIRICAYVATDVQPPGLLERLRRARACGERPPEERQVRGAGFGGGSGGGRGLFGRREVCWDWVAAEGGPWASSRRLGGEGRRCWAKSACGGCVVATCAAGVLSSLEGRAAAVQLHGGPEAA